MYFWALRSTTYTYVTFVFGTDFKIQTINRVNVYSMPPHCARLSSAIQEPDDLHGWAPGFPIHLIDKDETA